MRNIRRLRPDRRPALCPAVTAARRHHPASARRSKMVRTPCPADAGAIISRSVRGVWLLSGSLRIISNSQLVPRRGLEPPRLAAHGPEPCASTNSATWARRGALEGGRVAVNAVLRRLAPAHEFSVAVQRTGVDGAVFAGDGAPFRQVLRDRDADAGRVRRLSRGKPGRAAGARRWRRAAGVPVAAAGPCDRFCRGLADRVRCAICAIMRDRRPCPADAA